MLALVALFVTGIWIATGTGDSARRARQVRKGQTIAEVEAIMGGPPRAHGGGSVDAMGVREPLNFCYATPAEIQSSRVRGWISHLFNHFGFPSIADRLPWPGAIPWPVSIDFDTDGRVIFIAIDGKEFNP